MKNTFDALSIIGSCYKIGYSSGLYLLPYSQEINNELNDEIVTFIDQFQIFTIVNYCQSDWNDENITHNFKIITNNKIGWVTVEEKNLKIFFHEKIV